MHAVDLGTGAPRITNARIKTDSSSSLKVSWLYQSYLLFERITIAFMLDRKSTLTSHTAIHFLFHYQPHSYLITPLPHSHDYPFPSISRFPCFLASYVGFTLFLCYKAAHHSSLHQMTLTPPLPSDPNPVLTLTLEPSFNLQLHTTSLLGSRAKIADIPKVHQLIEDRVRYAIARKREWKIRLPYLGNPVVVEGQKEELGVDGSGKSAS